MLRVLMGAGAERRGERGVYDDGRRVVGDGGLTSIEIIVGVVLLAILVGVVVFQAFRFVNKADDSAASRSLEAAVTVVGVMGQLGSSGGGNLVGDPNPSTEIAITKLSEQLSGAELATLEQFGVKLAGTSHTFADVVGDAQRLWVNVPKKITIDEREFRRRSGSGGAGVLKLKDPQNPSLGTISNPNLGTLPSRYSNQPEGIRKYLVDPLKYPEFPDGNVYGFRVRPGNLVRVGVKSVSGATFCAISVRDGAVVGANSSSDVTGYVTTDKSKLIPINGIGYQSTDAKGTSYRIGGLPRPGADCGAFYIGPIVRPAASQGQFGPGYDHMGGRFVAELPGLPGTDARLMPPSTDFYG